jgi:transcriptional regulator with XRE-family HTH domain
MANPSKSDSSFAKRLRNLRSILGFTQRQLASEFRVTPGAVALWESGSRNLSGPETKLLELYEKENFSDSDINRSGDK